MEADGWKRIGAFLTLTALITAPFWWYVSQHRGAPAIADAGYGLMWAPAAAALIAGRAADLGWSWPARRYLLIGWLVPVGYTLVVYVSAWVAGAGRFAGADELAAARDYLHMPTLGPTAVIAVTAVSTLTLQTLGNAALALGEEIGWRGFLLPALARRMDLRIAGLISGLIWAAWHYPLFFLASHHGGGPSTAWGILWFTVMVAADGVTLGWLRVRSRSVWPAMLFHASHNAFTASCDSLTGDTGRTRWILGETGVGLAVVSVAIAIYVGVRFGDDRVLITRDA